MLQGHAPPYGCLSEVVAVEIAMHSPSKQALQFNVFWKQFHNLPD